MDGRLDEAVWQTAARCVLRRSDGRAPARQPTRVSAAWTAEALVLGFECRDDDISDPYRKRDDPLYLHEAVEVFLDPDGDRRDYVELEVSPAGTRFDASFQARRQGMDRNFDPASRVAAWVDGSLNRPGDRDRGWSVELVLPFDQLVGRGRRPPPAGDCWRANFFRLDKSRSGDEASSWRPTRGDFHDLDAFGRLCFTAAGEAN